MSNWRKIWNDDNRVKNIILDCLVRADGFDGGAGSFSVDDWLYYTNMHYEQLEIDASDSLFELGCGSGAFLYPLYLSGHKIGGLDYSETLIEIARRFLPGAGFVVQDALSLNTSELFNVVFSHSVFHYFESHAYAKTVVPRMLEKSKKKVAIFDINDFSKRDLYEQVRMAGLSASEYKKKYKGLDHQFYCKEWFEELADEFGVSIKIYDQSYEKYTNSELRFNVILEK